MSDQGARAITNTAAPRDDAQRQTADPAIRRLSLIG